MDEALPSPGRVVGAALMAALAAPAALALFLIALAPSETGVAVIALVFGFPVALVHALVIGAPAYILLREKWALTWIRSAVGGFAVAALPWGLFLLSMSPDRWNVALAAGMIGALGMVGGLAFAATLKF
ncbi:MAG: hypothetical protein ABWX67_06845 [Allosphingosinicella sp.]